MPKFKGRFRKFMRGLGGGGSEPGPPLPEGVVVATASHGEANETSPINRRFPEGDNSDSLVNGTCTVIRNSTGVSECESSSPSCEVKVLDEHDLSREIWIEAYTGLQNGESTKDMVHVYETILSQQLNESDEQNAMQTTNRFLPFGNDIERKIPQMKLVTENVLSDASEHSAIADGFTKAVGLVSELNSLVSPMIQSNPVAALAWGGICAALPFLLRPITAESDMATGLLHVMGRMQWYMSLVRGLLDGVDQERRNEQLYLQLKHTILDLYTDILKYQMQSVCYCYHDHAIMKALRAVVSLDDWKGQLESIQQLETMVQKDMHSFAAVETLASLAEIAHSTKKLDVIRRELAKIVTIQEQTRQEQEQRYLEAERTVRSELVGRFRTTDYEKQMKLNPSRVPGTCEWFCSHEKFKKWLSFKGPGLLLASADPGCGKSTLARYLVEEVLPESTDATILYFFFKDTPEQRLLANALCAVLHQLFYQKNGVAEKYKHQILQSTPLSDISALWALFAEACQDEDLGEVICVFDALDECEQEGVHILAKSLGRLLQNSGLNGGKAQARIKFLVTTRGYPDILEQFSDLNPGLLHLSGNDEDEKDQIQAEISLFLDYQLERLSQKKHFKTERKERISEALKAKGSGQRTYLWLTLMFQLLESTFKTTTRDWEKLIAKPPSTVNKAYEALLSRVDGDDKESVRILLHLIMAARRPLTLCEMNIALNVRDQSDASDEESLGLSADEEFKQWLVHTCGFFVTVYSERVYFIHETAKEFLLQSDLQEGESNHDWGHSITTRSANRMMAESCIAYLSLKQFSQRAFQERTSELQRVRLKWEASPSDTDLATIHSSEDILFTNYKFMQYAVEFWIRHLRACQYLHEAAVVDIGDIFFDKYLALFATNSSGPPLWFLVTLYQYGNLARNVDGYKEYRDEMIQRYSLWKAAAYCNHFRLLQYAVQSDNEGGAGCCISGIPLLHLAIFEDSSTEFLGLLAKYVNVDARDNMSGETALSMASSMGYLPAVETLLDHGADPKLANNNGFSPLSHAVRRYCFSSPPDRGELITMMSRLFSHGADANSTTALWELAPAAWYVKKASPLEIAAGIAGDLEDLQTELEAVVTSRSGGMNPHVSSLTQIVMCPDLDLFSEPAFLDAFDKSFIKFLIDHGATGLNQPGQIWKFYELVCMLGPDCGYPGYYDNSAVWGIAFLLHAGASPRQLGARDENEDSGISSTEINRLLSEIVLFGGRPATWMLLVKLLGYDPLSLEVKDGFRAKEFRNILHQAIAALEYPFADWVWFLLEHGQEIEDRDKSGHTPLHIACIEGRVALNTISFLLQRGADINAKNHKAQTPLHLASNAQVVEILCEYGADLNARDHREHTPLNTMYETGSFEIVKILLKHNANTTARDIDGLTPLHLVCNFSDFDDSIAQRAKLPLEEHHVDIDSRDARERTPLHVACEQDSAELLETLLAFKADPGAQDAEGQTPLHIFFQNGRYREAAIPMAKLLLAHIVDIEARDLKGRTVLHKAVSWGNEFVELLLSYGANVNARDSKSNTPLHLCDHRKNIGLLLEYGADIEARNSLGDTPAHRACREHYLRPDIKALLPFQPSLEARNLSGSTPLHLACQDDSSREFEILLEHQADIEARDSLGRTPLHYACEYSHGKLVRDLLEQGADVEARDLTGKTPLKLVHDILESSDAISSDHPDREEFGETIKLLCQFGAHVEIEMEQSIQQLSLLNNEN